MTEPSVVSGTSCSWSGNPRGGISLPFRFRINLPSNKEQQITFLPGQVHRDGLIELPGAVVWIKHHMHLRFLTWAQWSLVPFRYRTTTGRIDSADSYRLVTRILNDKIVRHLPIHLIDGSKIMHRFFTNH